MKNFKRLINNRKTYLKKLKEGLKYFTIKTNPRNVKMIPKLLEKLQKK